MKFFEIFVIVIVLTFVVGCQKTDVVEVPHPSPIRQVSVGDAKNDIETKRAQFIDVRSPEEFKAEHAATAINIPLETVETELARLDRTKPVYIICETGRRSQIAAETLKKNGFSEIYNVSGGTNEWTKAGLPTEKQ